MFLCTIIVHLNVSTLNIEGWSIRFAEGSRALGNLYSLLRKLNWDMSSHHSELSVLFTHKVSKLAPWVLFYTHLMTFNSSIKTLYAMSNARCNILPNVLTFKIHLNKNHSSGGFCLTVILI